MLLDKHLISMAAALLCVEYNVEDNKDDTERQAEER